MAALLPAAQVERRYLARQEVDAVAELLNLPAPPDGLLTVTIRGAASGVLLEVEYIKEEE